MAGAHSTDTKLRQGDTVTDIQIDNPGIRTPENGWFRFRIVVVEATVVSDGRMMPHEIAAFFPGLQSDDLRAAKARLGVEGTHFSMEQNCLVLRYPGHVVLFDTGVGTDFVYGWAHSGLLLRSMAVAGIQAADVTEVVLTHAHSDHAWVWWTGPAYQTFRVSGSLCHAWIMTIGPIWTRLHLAGLPQISFWGRGAICLPIRTG